MLKRTRTNDPDQELEAAVLQLTKDNLNGLLIYPEKEGIDLIEQDEELLLHTADEVKALLLDKTDDSCALLKATFSAIAQCSADYRLLEQHKGRFLDGLLSRFRDMLASIDVPELDAVMKSVILQAAGMVAKEAEE